MKLRTFLFAAIVVAVLAGAAQAATGPFGIGTPETGGSGFGGPLGPFFMWVALHQAHFYRALTSALSTLKRDPLGAWLLLALSFAYGVFHAVGPGHGKAVITSYLLASGETVRRGVPHLVRRGAGASYECDPFRGGGCHRSSPDCDCNDVSDGLGGDHQLCGNRARRRVALVDEVIWRWAPSSSPRRGRANA